jgi:predicted acyltransferase
LFLNGFPFFDLATIRVPGVLQRIAICYAVVAALNLYSGPRLQAGLAFALMFGYWVLLDFVKAPGSWFGNLELPGTLPAWVDRGVFGPHKWKPDYDPEGLLSTIPAIATTIWGVMAGHWVGSWRTRFAEMAGLLACGLAGIILGLAWDRSFPMNKALWTSSFVAFTAGWAAIVLGLCVAIVDVAQWRRWATPFLVFGMNPILAFVGSGVLARVLGLVPITDAGRQVSLKTFLYEHAFASWTEPKLASLLFALSFLTVCFLALLPLYRRGWAVRI